MDGQEMQPGGFPTTLQERGEGNECGAGSSLLMGNLATEISTPTLSERFENVYFYITIGFFFTYLREIVSSFPVF